MPNMQLPPLSDDLTGVPVSGSWYRGGRKNFYPSEEVLSRPESAGYVVMGWEPRAPFIESNTRIAAIGSCFAAELARALKAKNLNVGQFDDSQDIAYSHMVRVSAGLENTFAMLQHLEFALEGRDLRSDLWVDRDGRPLDISEPTREAVKSFYSSTDVFIFTFGLSEIWCDAESGEPFWRAIPVKRFDSRKHAFRLSTVDENRTNIVRIANLIWKHNQTAKIIFTLSPVPLIATFRPHSCMTANEVSKATLRVAIDEAMAELAPQGQAYYWPSYEFVRCYFKHAYMADGRHIKPEIVNRIIDLFFRYFAVE